MVSTLVTEHDAVASEIPRCGWRSEIWHFRVNALDRQGLPGRRNRFLGHAVKSARGEMFHQQGSHGFRRLFWYPMRDVLEHFEPVRPAHPVPRVECRG